MEPGNRLHSHAWLSRLPYIRCMNLYYWRGSGPLGNFGDELNPWIWSRLAPELLESSDDGLVLVAIGSLLNNRLPGILGERFPQADGTVVFGSGVGYGEGLPTIGDSWKFYCVRGPRSAAALGLEPSLAITDPACLIADYIEKRSPAVRYALMPHWQTAHPVWERIAAGMGWGYIDPRWPLERVLQDIGSTHVLLTEAMHGAVVADALRIPWIPLTLSDNVLPFKWRDWCDSLGLPYRPGRVPRAWPKPRDAGGWWQRAKRRLKLRLVETRLLQLSRTARPLLSDGRRLSSAAQRLRERVEQLREDYATGNLLPGAFRY